MRTRHRVLVLVVLAAVGIAALSTCSSGDGSKLDAAGSDGEVQALGTGGEDGGETDGTTTTAAVTDTGTEVSSDGSDGVFPDSDIPAEAFDNKPADTDGAKELPSRIQGYNYVDREIGDQFSQTSPELAGVEVTLRSLDAVPRTGSGYRPQIIVMKSPEATRQFQQGVWQAQEKTVAGVQVWVIGGADASTQVAWVKNADTVIILSGAPYALLEPIMVDLITNAP